MRDTFVRGNKNDPLTPEVLTAQKTIIVFRSYKNLHKLRHTIQSLLSFFFKGTSAGAEIKFILSSLMCAQKK